MIFTEDEVINRVILYESITIPFLSRGNESEFWEWISTHFRKKDVDVLLSYHQDTINVEFKGNETGNLTREDLTEFKLRWL